VREIMEAKTCFCSRPKSLLRVCAYKEGRHSPTLPTPPTPTPNPFLVPVGDLLDAVFGISQGPLSR